MNDCIWMMIGICEGLRCPICGNGYKYISINDEEGQFLSEEWQKQVELALIPARREFAIEFGWLEEVEK